MKFIISLTLQEHINTAIYIMVLVKKTKVTTDIYRNVSNHKAKTCMQ